MVIAIANVRCLVGWLSRRAHGILQSLCIQNGQRLSRVALAANCYLQGLHKCCVKATQTAALGALLQFQNVTA